jgi:hypothetical protein
MATGNTVGTLDIEVGLRLQKVETGFAELQTKLRKNNDQIRRETANLRKDVDNEMSKIGHEAFSGINRSLGLHHAIKGLFMGLGFGSIEQAKELIAEPWKEAAEDAKKLAEYSEKSVEAQKKLFEYKLSRTSAENQAEEAKKEYAKLAARLVTENRDAEQAMAEKLRQEGNPILGTQTAYYGGAAEEAQVAAERAAQTKLDLESAGLKLAQVTDRLNDETAKKKQEEQKKLTELAEKEAEVREKILDLDKTTADLLADAYKKRDAAYGSGGDAIKAAEADLRIAELKKKVEAEATSELDKQISASAKLYEQRQHDAEQFEKRKTDILSHIPGTNMSDHLLSSGLDLGAKGEIAARHRVQLSAMDKLTAALNRLANASMGGMGGAVLQP